MLRRVRPAPGGIVEAMYGDLVNAGNKAAAAWLDDVKPLFEEPELCQSQKQPSPRRLCAGSG